MIDFSYGNAVFDLQLQNKNKIVGYCITILIIVDSFNQKLKLHFKVHKVHFNSLESEGNAESKAGLTLHGATEPILMFCSQVAQTGIVTSMCQKENSTSIWKLIYSLTDHSSFICGNKSDMTKSKQTNFPEHYNQPALSSSCFNWSVFHSNPFAGTRTRIPHK